jgi:hypothetical protein
MNLMKTARIFSAVLAAGFALTLPAVASAQGSQVAMTGSTAQKRTFTHPPISVQSCNPSQNNYVAAGYTPAFYPAYAGGYWGWPAVYGPAYNYYQYPVQGNPTLGIDYHNATNIVMKDIEFGLVARGSLVAEVRDVGTFSPGAEIKHEFGLSPNVFPLHTGLAQCVPLKIVFADGTKWTNPHLPALRASIYHHP